MFLVFVVVGFHVCQSLSILSLRRQCHALINHTISHESNLTWLPARVQINACMLNVRMFLQGVVCQVD